MGYEKIATLAERCARYAKACGKTSILETMPIKNINFAELGICLSDGTIRFQSEKAALNYAKNACMKSKNLPPSQQFEIAVVREGNIILGQANGTRSNCPLSDLKIFSMENRRLRRGKPKTLELEHYHPDLYGKGKTNPLSIGTYNGDVGGGLAGLNLKSITAYNSLGQYNKLEALPNFNQELAFEFAKKHQELMTQQLVPKEKLERFHLLESIERLSEDTNFLMSPKSRKEYSNLRMEINRFLRKYQETPEYARITHNFLLENAEKYGMKYSTDMIF